MAKKQKENAKLLETVQFEDLEQAKRAVTFAKINQIRILVGFAIAAIATCLAAYGMWGNADDPMIFYVFACVLAIPAYLIGGGIGKALKVAWNITKLGWFLIPAFPADLLLGAVFFVFSIVGLLFVPIIFVGLNYIQHKKTLDAAKNYLVQCGYALSSADE